MKIAHLNDLKVLGGDQVRCKNDNETYEVIIYLQIK